VEQSDESSPRARESRLLRPVALIEPKVSPLRCLKELEDARVPPRAVLRRDHTTGRIVKHGTASEAPGGDDPRGPPPPSQHHPLKSENGSSSRQPPWLSSTLGGGSGAMELG